MICPQCQTENPDSNRFCAKCDAPLLNQESSGHSKSHHPKVSFGIKKQEAVQPPTLAEGNTNGMCAECGTQNPHTNRFCAKCDAPLQSSTLAKTGIAKSSIPAIFQVRPKPSRASLDASDLSASALKPDEAIDASAPQAELPTPEVELISHTPKMEPPEIVVPVSPPPFSAPVVNTPPTVPSAPFIASLPLREEPLGPPSPKASVALAEIPAQQVVAQGRTFCSKCGASLGHGSAFCAACGTQVHAASQTDLQTSSIPLVRQAPLMPPMQVTVNHAPIQRQTEPPAYYKNPSIATVLSFFWTGLGQCYNGEVGKGMILIFIRIISIPLFFIPLIGWLFIIPGLIFWGWGMSDAHKSAERLNRKMATQMQS